MLKPKYTTETELKLTALVPHRSSHEREIPQRPYYSPKDSLVTRNLHINGLVLSYLIAITSILVGVLAVPGTAAFRLKPIPREIIALCIEPSVTIVTETLGSIHGTSLHWALFHENRLEFNTNLRLFTATHHAPNSVVSNAVFLLCIAVCYAAGSLVLVSNTYIFYLSDGGVV